eukprot:scaffold167447_cov33-Tisochrysis_lutea.AAC.1
MLSGLGPAMLPAFALSVLLPRVCLAVRRTIGVVWNAGCCLYSTGATGCERGCQAVWPLAHALRQMSHSRHLQRRHMPRRVVSSLPSRSVHTLPQFSVDIVQLGEPAAAPASSAIASCHRDAIARAPAREKN